MCICTMYINTSCICIYIIRINYVCLSLRLFVSSSFIQHVHKMLHGNTLQTLRHQALWHSNNVGNLRNSCIPSGIRHQNFAFEARLHDRPKFQVIHRASKKQASSSIFEHQGVPNGVSGIPQRHIAGSARLSDWR